MINLLYELHNSVLETVDCYLARFKEDELGLKKNTTAALCVVCDDDDIQANIDKAISAGAFWDAEISEHEVVPGKYSGRVWDPFGYEWTLVGNGAAEVCQ